MSSLLSARPSAAPPRPCETPLLLPCELRPGNSADPDAQADAEADAEADSEADSEADAEADACSKARHDRRAGIVSRLLRAVPNAWNRRLRLRGRFWEWPQLHRSRQGIWL